MKILSTILALLLAVSLSACGGSSGGGSAGVGANSGSVSSGSLSLGITDAPVDEASRVIVEFTGLQIQPSVGERISYDFDIPRQIDLLALNGGGSELLLDKVKIAAGHYDWIRLNVNAECDIDDSYIDINNVKYPLWIPSGGHSGLKLVRGFDVPEGGSAHFTIDFDLRKAVKYPQGKGTCAGNYKLRPAQALRMVDNAKSGSIAGVVYGIVDALLINDGSCTGGNSVYVFEGHNVVPDDVDGINPDPVTSAMVELDASGLYKYRAAFLSAGDYTVAFTCQAKDDDDADNNIDFWSYANVTVFAGEETVLHFMREAGF